AVPPLADVPLECEQVAQLDSKDMTHAVWQRLARRCAHHLARAEVAGVVVTHGTDTLEETAYVLHRVLAPAKPLVLTAAMRPATSLQADGPQNLLDAVTVARSAVRGVVAVIAGQVHGAADLRKVHTWRLDAFSSGDAGPVALVESARVRVLREPPVTAALGVDALAADPSSWPRVEVAANHAGADGVSRCAFGPVIDADTGDVATATPWQARVDLLLELLARG
ncbi:MAG: asparaginase, partial [Burkholderiaceae bacterium]|nr:asparaginase [Burkholderiaceae bacterium]